uniref:Late embryogenesis abundant protein LEA-2 subgroup domain-containing protein n=1 Tax=Helicotheca tamesis TaxID=374047 RepID=A0A7S2IBG2_9STRA|mmetsp:Transcript_7399/g.10055  ORF Transcript_7399/g.10055 Transcript_7399/m.10055 type:complete len:184 (+) Transcript_7399:382-933(+)
MHPVPKKFFSWFCILLLPMLLGITAGVLVAYWPQDPQVNDCTQTVDLFGLVTNFLVGDVSAPMVFLLSIYNPNRVDIGIRDLSGVISYQNVQFGTFSVPDFTAQSRHIIDVEADVLLTLPPPSIVTQMYQDYLDDTLVVTFRVNVGYKVAGFSGSVTDYTESIRTGFREDSDDKNYALCKCGQ